MLKYRWEAVLGGVIVYVLTALSTQLTNGAIVVPPELMPFIPIINAAIVAFTPAIRSYVDQSTPVP